MSKQQVSGSENNHIQLEYYRYLIESSCFAVIGLDCQGIIVSWNHMAEELFHTAAVHIMGHHLNSIIPENSRDLVEQAVEKAVSRHETSEFEMAYRDDNNRQQQLMVFISPILSHDQTNLGVSVWIRDFTHYKNLQQKLIHAEKMASMGTLAAGVAHHFNNIIGGVGIFVDYALSSNNSQAARRALQMTADAANRIGKITSSLLTFAEQDIQNKDLSDLTEIVLTFCHLVEGPLSNKNIKLELNLQPIPVLEVPGPRVHQMLGNLLDNAEIAMPEGGTIHISLSQEKGNIVLVFGDTGCGIDSKVLPHIFEPFYTTLGTISGGNSNSSSGLGLAVVHGIVRELGGDIKVESKLGAGTTFYITLPVPQKDKD